MGHVWPKRRFPKVSRFLTSKPGVQRRIGLLATWRTSEDCVEAKKIKSSSWSSVPDISALDKTRLPTQTPPPPPPQEWEDLNDTEEEDPEELVPDLSDEE
ncbi:hypothetical protein U9M48_035333 [Paspalum notatum var. saurae]|uniref:Uncharacterized protein n=1 Tax=Paspalum notatum var. saurae TaxID=547442 RepID=A0AAQ3X7Q9_PASNO